VHWSSVIFTPWANLSLLYDTHVYTYTHRETEEYTHTLHTSLQGTSERAENSFCDVPSQKRDRRAGGEHRGDGTYPMWGVYPMDIWFTCVIC
jgi:hypothetical protein